METLALVKMIKFFRCSADYLENDGNRTLAAVEIGDSKRNTLALAVCSENDKLTRFCLCGNLGSVYLH